MTKRTLAFGLLGIVVLVAVGWFVRSGGEQTRDLMVQPERGPFRVTVTTTGELQAKNSVEITGPREARRARLFNISITRLIPEGTVVERGDFVAELDRSELTSRLQDVRLELQTAQSQFEQTRLDTSLTLSEARDQQVNLRYAMEEAELRKEQAAYEAPSVRRQAQIDYEKAQRDYEQALANYETKVKQAEAQMREVGAELRKAENELADLESLSAKFTIRAPENGMVVYKRDRRGRKLTEGGTISPWDPTVATLPDLSVMQSITYVNEVDIQKVKARQPVEIGLDAAPSKRLTGTVTSVANIGEERPNSDAKVFRVEVEIAQRDTTLRPAMTTSNTIVVAERENALHIPLETVHTQDSLTYVFARRGGSLVRQQVRLGLLNENRAIVDAGVRPEDDLYLSLPADTSGLPLLTLDGEPPGEEQLAQRTP
jgi:multidrug efflux pump subunit AcrA (membrane-fusion protein)